MLASISFHPRSRHASSRWLPTINSMSRAITIGSSSPISAIESLSLFTQDRSSGRFRYRGTTTSESVIFTYPSSSATGTRLTGAALPALRMSANQPALPPSCNRSSIPFTTTAACSASARLGHGKEKDSSPSPILHHHPPLLCTTVAFTCPPCSAQSERTQRYQGTDSPPPDLPRLHPV